MASWTVSFGYISRLHSSSLWHSWNFSIFALLPTAATALSWTINSNTPQSPISNLDCCSALSLHPADDPNWHPLIVSPLLMLTAPIWKTHSWTFELYHDVLPFCWHCLPSWPLASTSCQLWLGSQSAHWLRLSCCLIRWMSCSLCFSFWPMTYFVICWSSPPFTISCSQQRLWTALLGWGDCPFLAF